MLARLIGAALLMVGCLQLPAYAGGPEEVVGNLYESRPWQDLPPGGHGLWYVDIGLAWETGAADAGKAFLVGDGGVAAVKLEVINAMEYEARVRAVLSRADGSARTLNFGLIGDDDEDDRWRIAEVFTDGGEYLSEILAQR